MIMLWRRWFVAALVGSFIVGSVVGFVAGDYNDPVGPAQPALTDPVACAVEEDDTAVLVNCADGVALDYRDAPEGRGYYRRLPERPDGG